MHTASTNNIADVIDFFARESGREEVDNNLFAFAKYAFEIAGKYRRNISLDIADRDPQLPVHDWIKSTLKKHYSPLALLGCTRSIVVYFVPGLERPISIRWGDWPKLLRDRMSNRIEKLHRILSHSGFKPEKTIRGHLFECMHAEAHELAKMSRGERRDETPLSIVIENIGTEESPVQMPGGRHQWTISDDIRRDFQGQALIATPVLATDESFVLFVSYYQSESPFTIKHEGITLEIDTDQLPSLIDLILNLHEYYAYQFVAPLYSLLIQPNIKDLTEVTPSLLENAAQRLGSDSPFTYRFTWGDASLPPLWCNDMKRIMFHNLGTESGDVFGSVLMLEEAIYSDLVDSGVLLGNARDKWLLPKDMPLNKVLKEFEEIERGIKMYNRDHTLHQFQTFLMGTLFIARYYDSFKNALCTGDDGVFNDMDDDAILLFMKRAWFLVSTLHDVGNPIQDFDDVSDMLRKQVAELLHLDDEHLGAPQRIRIDELLYDDPRTYTILRDLSSLLSEVISERAPGTSVSPENLWWVIRRLTFEKKHHAMASAVAVAMQLVANGPKISQFDTNPLYRMVAKHILLPILLHHVYEWAGWLDDMVKEDKHSTTAARRAKKGAVKLIQELFGEECKYGKVITFNDFPLAVLLTVCDIVQEFGRPSGNAKECWPDTIDGVLSFDESHDDPQLNIYMHYSSKSLGKAELDDFESRQERWDRLKGFMEFGELGRFKTHITGVFLNTRSGRKYTTSLTLE